MGKIEYIKAERISLKRHPILTQNWVQKRIAEDPAILGLGTLEPRNVERPNAEPAL